MADKNKTPPDDLSIEEILAEARTLNGKDEPEPDKKQAEQGKPSESEPQPRRPQPVSGPETIVKQAQQALESKITEPSPLPGNPGKKEEKKKRSLFGRRKREIPEFEDEDDIYYGLQLKSLEEYQRDYEKTIRVDSTKMRQAEKDSSFSYLFDQNSNTEPDAELDARFEQLHSERRKRIEQALRKAGLDQDEIFSLYENEIAEAPEPSPVPEPVPTVMAQAVSNEPQPQEEPAPKPEQPPVPPPAVPTPSPAPAPKPEILPGPQRQTEIPMPITEPTFQPEPERPSAPTQPGYLPEVRYPDSEEPVKEPVTAPQVKEEIPPSPPVKEPPIKPIPFSGAKPGYRFTAGKPVHMIDLSDFNAVLLAEAKNYPLPQPEPPPAPIPMPERNNRTEFKAPIIIEQTSEFDAIQPEQSAQAEEPALTENPVFEERQPIHFPEPLSEQEEYGELEDFALQEEPEKPGKETKKRKTFSVFGTEEEDNDSQEEPPAEPDELDDYSSPSDAPSVLHELGSSVRRLSLRLAVTGICMVLLFGAGFLGEYSGILPQAVQVSLGMQPYLILNLVFLLIATVFCIGPILNGIKGLFTIQANSDSAMALADIAAIIQSVALFFSQDKLQNGALHLYSSLVAFILFLNTAGKMSLVTRINKNFKFVSAPEQKQSVQLFDDHNTALQMAKGCVIDAPAIAYQTKTNFLKHFLRLSYEPDPSEQASQIMAPIGFIGSLVLCIATLILSKDVLQALTAFAAATCVSVPLVNMLSVNLPLNRLSKIASRCGAMIIGYPAVEQFSNTNAVMLDAKELFPKGTVLLNGIKTFGGQRIDEAIVDATALMCAIGGPLSDLFDQIIKSRRDMLPKIDNVTYEDDRGVTGWVSGRRILVGNRELMEAHEIEPPSRDYEEKYIHGGKKIVYLASGGDLVAMFIVSYNSDRRRALELRRMEDNGISLIVRTCDPNITPLLLAECFGLETHGIRVLPERLGSIYTELTGEPQERTAALLATKGRSTAMMRMLTACVRQRSNISAAVILQNIAVILGFLLVAFLTCYSGLQQLSTSALLLYELFWSAAILIVPRLRKP